MTAASSLPLCLLEGARNPSWLLSSFHPWPWRARRRCSRHRYGFPISSPCVVKEGGQANCHGERSCCRCRCRCRRRFMEWKVLSFPHCLFGSVPCLFPLPGRLTQT